MISIPVLVAVSKNVKFLKSWNATDDNLFGEGYSYFDKNNEIAVLFIIFLIAVLAMGSASAASNI